MLAICLNLNPHLPRKPTFAWTLLVCHSPSSSCVCSRRARSGPPPPPPSSVPRVAKPRREILQTLIAIPALPPSLHAHGHPTGPPALPGRLARLRPPLRRVAAVFLGHLPDNAHRGWLVIFGIPEQVQGGWLGSLMIMMVRLRVCVNVRMDSCLD
ncbi:hypothetical protein LX36DRAFT_129581 [Colletotrichum falcatum]|nr:hypothetical protein LX36DRAFT_129581 [Colletotrichum falcatum]